MIGPIRERLLTALSANAYRGQWSSDHDTLLPLAWDADDIVDRIIEDARLGDLPMPSAPSGVSGRAERILTPDFLASIQSEFDEGPPVEVRRIRTPDGLMLVIGPLVDAVLSR